MFDDTPQVVGFGVARVEPDGTTAIKQGGALVALRRPDHAARKVGFGVGGVEFNSFVEVKQGSFGITLFSAGDGPAKISFGPVVA